MILLGYYSKIKTYSNLNDANSQDVYDVAQALENGTSRLSVLEVLKQDSTTLA